MSLDSNLPPSLPVEITSKASLSPVSSSSSSLPDKQPHTLSKRFPQKNFTQLVIVAALALMVAAIALPQYLDSSWPWLMPPKLQAQTRTALQAIPAQGLDIPGWATTGQAKTKLGGKNWSVQQLSTTAAETAASTASSSQQSNIFLLLRAQTYEGDQPEVEWLDIKGSQNWDTDSHRPLSFEVPRKANVKVSPQESISSNNKSQTVRIKGDFFRAWNKDQTYAVLQWYAWDNGGNDSPAHWFWADQIIQWNRRQRMPWVAVSIWLPIEPFSDIEAQQRTAESLGKALQQTLSDKVFLPSKPIK